MVWKVLMIILIVLVVVLAVLYFLGKRAQKAGSTAGADRSSKAVRLYAGYR